MTIVSRTNGYSRKLPSLGAFNAQNARITHVADGGMARVFRVQTHNKNYAAKVWNTPKLRDAEIKAFEELPKDCPHLVRIHGTGTIVLPNKSVKEAALMEYMSGETAEEMLARYDLLDVPSAIDVGLKVVSALIKAEMLHKDLKPENIFLTEEGEVVLFDFGLTNIEADSGVIIGTRQYLPPEVLTGHPLDQRSDMYSLGVTLYELVTGFLPYDEDGEDDGCFAMLSEKIRSKIPAKLERQMHKEPEIGFWKLLADMTQRYQSDRPATLNDLFYRMARLQV